MAVLGIKRLRLVNRGHALFSIIERPIRSLFERLSSIGPSKTLYW